MFKGRFSVTKSSKNIHDDNTPSPAVDEENDENHSQSSHNSNPKASNVKRQSSFRKFFSKKKTKSQSSFNSLPSDLGEPPSLDEDESLIIQAPETNELDERGGTASVGDDGNTPAMGADNDNGSDSGEDVDIPDDPPPDDSTFDDPPPDDSTFDDPPPDDSTFNDPPPDDSTFNDPPPDDSIPDASIADSSIPYTSPRSKRPPHPLQHANSTLLQTLRSDLKKTTPNTNSYNSADHQGRNDHDEEKRNQTSRGLIRGQSLLTPVPAKVRGNMRPSVLNISEANDMKRSSAVSQSQSSSGLNAGLDGMRTLNLPIHKRRLSMSTVKTRQAVGASTGVGATGVPSSLLPGHHSAGASPGGHSKAKFLFGMSDLKEGTEEEEGGERRGSQTMKPFAIQSTTTDLPFPPSTQADNDGEQGPNSRDRRPGRMGVGLGLDQDAVMGGLERLKMISAEKEKAEMDGVAKSSGVLDHHSLQQHEQLQGHEQEQQQTNEEDDISLISSLSGGSSMFLPRPTKSKSTSNSNSGKSKQGGSSRKGGSHVRNQSVRGSALLTQVEGGSDEEASTGGDEDGGGDGGAGGDDKAIPSLTGQGQNNSHGHGHSHTIDTKSRKLKSKEHLHAKKKAQSKAKASARRLAKEAEKAEAEYQAHLQEEHVRWRIRPKKHADESILMRLFAYVDTEEEKTKVMKKTKKPKKTKKSKKSKKTKESGPAVAKVVQRDENEHDKNTITHEKLDITSGDSHSRGKDGRDKDDSSLCYSATTHAPLPSVVSRDKSVTARSMRSDCKAVDDGEDGKGGENGDDNDSEEDSEDDGDDDDDDDDDDEVIDVAEGSFGAELLQLITETKEENHKKKLTLEEKLKESEAGGEGGVILAEEDYVQLMADFADSEGGLEEGLEYWEMKHAGLGDIIFNSITSVQSTAKMLHKAKPESGEAEGDGGKKGLSRTLSSLTTSLAPLKMGSFVSARADSERDDDEGDDSFQAQMEARRKKYLSMKKTPQLPRQHSMFIEEGSDLDDSEDEDEDGGSDHGIGIVVGKNHGPLSLTSASLASHYGSVASKGRKSVSTRGDTVTDPVALGVRDIAHMSPEEIEVMLNELNDDSSLVSVVSKHSHMSGKHKVMKYNGRGSSASGSRAAEKGSGKKQKHTNAHCHQQHNHHPVRKRRFKDLIWGRAAEHMQATTRQVDPLMKIMREEAEMLGSEIMDDQFGERYSRRSKWEGVEAVRQRERREIRREKERLRERELIAATALL